MDAFVHVLEQYLTYPADAPLQDRLAESILATLIEVGPRTLAQPRDYESRASFMWGATLAQTAIKRDRSNFSRPRCFPRL